jgi:hypothetical protein
MSPDEFRNLRARAAEKVRRGDLPCAEPSRAWGGPSPQKAPCRLCDEPITGMELEAQFLDGTGTTVATSLRFHTFCFAVWEIARAEDCR